MICLITIGGYYLKYIINNFLIYNENKKGLNPNKEYNYFKKICILYPASILLSIIIYIFFACIFTKKKEKEKCCCSCKCCESEDEYSLCQICGYTIYSQKIVLLKKTPTCNCLRLSCRILDNCLPASCYSLLLFCPCEDCDEERQATNFNEFSCCMNSCGCNADDIVYDKSTEYFCYCYQERRKLNFIYKYINNEITRGIFPYIIEYFCLRFATIGFERQCELIDKDDKMNSYNYTNITNETEIFNKTNFIYSNNLFLFLEDNFTGDIQNNSDSFDFSFMLIFIGSFILFFYLTISLSRIIEKFFLYTKKDKEEKISQLSEKILNGIHGIYSFNTIFSFIFSWFGIFWKNKLKDMVDKSFNFLYIPIFVNKYLFFTINYYIICYLESTKGFELIPISAVVSVYFFIGDYLLDFIREYPNDDNIKILFIIQIIFSIIGFSLSLYLIIYIVCSFCCYPKKLFKLLFCCLTYFCLSGFCYNYEECFEDEDENEEIGLCKCSNVSCESEYCIFQRGKCYFNCCCCEQNSCFSCECCSYNCSDCDCSICFCCCLCCLE